ncbi:MAG: RDD family protein [Bacteroidota bacterium]
MNEHNILDDQESSPKDEQVRFAGFWIRFGATFIDELVMIPINLLITYNAIAMKSLPLLLMLSILKVVYKPLFEWQRGATPGKMVVGIGVVSEQFQSISAEQAMIRYLPWAIADLIAISASILLYQLPEFAEVTDYAGLLQLMENAPLQTVNQAYFFIFALLVGQLAFDPRYQGFHDKHAQTFVIYERK